MADKPLTEQEVRATDWFDRWLKLNASYNELEQRLAELEDELEMKFPARLLYKHKLAEAERERDHWREIASVAGVAKLEAKLVQAQAALEVLLEWAQRASYHVPKGEDWYIARDSAQVALALLASQPDGEEQDETL